MKQNERLLVYAVTGFLAVILVIAVWFGNDAAAGLRSKTDADNSAQELEGRELKDIGDLLGTKKPEGTPASGDPVAPGAGNTPGAGNQTGEQPLVSRSTAMVAADLVAQQLGPSRREYTVRWVTARAGDSLETLVVRWCGSRDFVEKALRLNEDLGMLKIGKEVAVPWVDDEIVLEVHEARQAKKLAGVANGDRGIGLNDGNLPTGGGQAPAGPSRQDSGRIGDLLQPQVPESPGFREPGAGADTGALADKSAVGQNAGVLTADRGLVGGSGATRYTVKSGDSLWAIAARTYGRTQADKMVPEIKRANPGVTEKLKPDQVLVLPPKS